MDTPPPLSLPDEESFYRFLRAYAMCNFDMSAVHKIPKENLDAHFSEYFMDYMAIVEDKADDEEFDMYIKIQDVEYIVKPHIKQRYDEGFEKRLYLDMTKYPEIMKAISVKLFSNVGEMLVKDQGFQLAWSDEHNDFVYIPPKKENPEG